MNAAPTLSRRTLLKGVGAMLALPWLESVQALGASATSERGALSRASGKPPVRMAVLYMANGVNPHTWTPGGNGADFIMSSALEPLSVHKKDLLVLTNLWNAAANTGDGHYVKTSGFLTGRTIVRTTGSELRNGQSMDQLCASHIGNFTLLPSLELGLEPPKTGVDPNVGYTQIYGSQIAWASATTPLAKEVNPRLVFDRMFRGTASKRGRKANYDRSVIDVVFDDAKALKKLVSQVDQRKLDEYLESVRSVERRIEFEAERRKHEFAADPLVSREIDRLNGRLDDFYLDPTRASERSGDHTEYTRLMLDLMALAFWTDSTRISTFMFGNAVSAKNFSFLDGVKGGHHELSHHENDPAKLMMCTKINRWHTAQYAYLLDKLRSLPEGDGNVLDNSMILFGAGMRDSNGHVPHNLPIMIGGRGGGTLSPGRHLVYDRDTPLCNLYVSMLNRMGSSVSGFADSTGELPGLNDPTYCGQITGGRT